jgi:hypothetical protein
MTLSPGMTQVGLSLPAYASLRPERRAVAPAGRLSWPDRLVGLVLLGIVSVWTIALCLLLYRAVVWM